MTDFTLTKTSFEGGVWTGVLEGVPQGEALAPLRLMQDGQPLAEGVVEPDVSSASQRIVRFELPARVLGDGLRTLLVQIEGQDMPLAVIRLMGDDQLQADVQSDLDALRAELDLLKSAFRRHCAETM